MAPWEALDRAREAALDPAERRRLGAFHTPPDIALRLADLVVDDPGLVVADPACGGGAFLIAAGEVLVALGADRRHVVERQLLGADIDPDAVAATRDALRLWSGGAEPRVDLADGLAWQPAGGRRPDVVLGNPPFRSPLAAGARAGRLAAYTDLAGRFLVAAVELVRPGGVVLLLQPESVLASRDAAPVRAAASVEGLWVAGEPVFDAAVRVCAPLLRAGPGPQPRRVRRWQGRAVRPAGTAAFERGAPTWAHLRPDAPPRPRRRPTRTVGDLATATAGFRDQFYGLAAAATDGGDGPPLVTSGLVDPGRIVWGERPARLAGQRYLRPTVDVERLDEPLRRWVDARRTPKVLVATQTRVIEAAADPDGRFVPVTPVIAVHPHDRADTWRLAAALTGPSATAAALHHWGGTGLGAGAVKLAARQVLELPLPDDDDAWATATTALERGDVDACAAALATGRLLAWWRARAPQAV